MHEVQCSDINELGKNHAVMFWGYTVHDMNKERSRMHKRKNFLSPRWFAHHLFELVYNSTKVCLQTCESLRGYTAATQ